MTESTRRPAGREVISALRNTDGLVGFTAKVDRAVLAAEVRALWAEREAVLALHRDAGPSQGYTDDGGYDDMPACCGTCGEHGEYGVPWPCPTVQALGGGA